MTATKPKPRSLLHLPRKIIIELVLAVAFVVPVYLFIQEGRTNAPGRADPPSVASVVDVPIGRFNNALPILIYHDISNRGGHFTVTPQRFAEQMAALKHAGFHTVTAKQLFAWMFHGTKLPSRPVLITFDDGLGSFWRVADPILAKYGFHAMAFVISGQIGKHGYYYMHPQELRDMAKSGRWDLEAHTYYSHIFIQTGPYSWGPALANRKWLPKLGRVETLQEYHDRIAADFRRNVLDLRSYGATPQIFAYPFSAVGTPSNDRHVFSILDKLVEQYFAMSFVDNAGQRFVTRYDTRLPQHLPRIEVYNDTTAERLMKRIQAITPIPPRVNGMPASGWFTEATNRGLEGLVQNGTLTLQKPQHKWMAAYWLPSTTQLWRNYQASVTVERLGPPKSGTAGTLLIGVSGFHGYAVTISNNRVSIRTQVSGRTLWEGDLSSDAATHRLTVRFTDRLTVSADGQTLKTIAVDKQAHGGIGFGTWREKTSATSPTFRSLTVQPI